MAEFERRIKLLFSSQRSKIEAIPRFYDLANEGKIEGEFGTFRMVRNRERGPEYETQLPDELLMFCRYLRGQGTSHLEFTRVRSIRLIDVNGEAVTIPNRYLRVANPLYTGWYMVNKSGWIIMNVKDKVGNPIMRDDIYEELLEKRGSRRLRFSNVDLEMAFNTAPAILVHPDYQGTKVQVVSFDPLVDTVMSSLSLHPTPLDAAVFDEIGELVPKVVRRLGTILLPQI